MRIIDLLLEQDVKMEITNDLMDIIATYRQKKVLALPFKGSEGVIQYLHNLGHDVTPTELMPLLSQPPFDQVVERTTPEGIYIKSNAPEQPVSKNKQEISKDHVKNVATKAATKAVKTGDKV